MVQDTPSRKLEQYIVRFPEGMRERIKTAASKSGRSMNAEIIHRLANSLDSPKFEDASLAGFDEDLNFSLMTAAALSGRSLMGEVVHRLTQSLAPEITLVNELEQQAWNDRRRYEDLMRLFIQLTPEERRLLEERAEIMDMAKDRKFSSKQIGLFVELNPIGKRGRIALTQPKSDYSAVIDATPDETDDDTPS